MNKDKFLSYYKFNPSKWLSGNITLCSYESKGMFIDLCALFWAREGILKEAFVEQMFNKCSANVKQELFDLEIISYNDGLLQIDFLINQLDSFEGTSEKRADAGRKSAEARKKIKQNPNASNKIRHNLTNDEQTSTIKIREENIREDKRREDKIKTPLEKAIDDFIDMRKKMKKPLTENAKGLLLQKLNELSKVEEEQIQILEQSTLNCWQGVFPLAIEKKIISQTESREQKNINILKNWKPSTKGDFYD